VTAAARAARAAGRPRHQPEPDLRDHAEGPLAAGQQRHEVVARAVLEQTRQPADDRAVRQHRLGPEQLRAHRAVPQHPDAAGVGGHQAADRGGVAGGEVHAEVQPGGAGVRLQRSQRDPRPDGHLPCRDVDLAEVVEPGQAEQHLTAARHRTAHQAGVATLHDHRHPGVVARLEHRGDLRGVPWADHAAGPRGEAAGPVGLVRRGEVGVDQHVLGTDGGPQLLQGEGDDGGHASTRSRTVSGRARSAPASGSTCAAPTSVTT
jgi:hypothetical protein